MKKILLAIPLFFLLIYGRSQSIPSLWPTGDRVQQPEKDSVKVFDENGILRMKIWYDSSSRDSIILGYRNTGKIEFRFDGKRRNPLVGCIRIYYGNGQLKEKQCFTIRIAQRPVRKSGKKVSF